MINQRARCTLSRRRRLTSLLFACFPPAPLPVVGEGGTAKREGVVNVLLPPLGNSHNSWLWIGNTPVGQNKKAERAERLQHRTLRTGGLEISQDRRHA